MLSVCVGAAKQDHETVLEAGHLFRMGQGKQLGGVDIWAMTWEEANTPLKMSSTCVLRRKNTQTRHVGGTTVRCVQNCKRVGVIGDTELRGARNDRW